MCKVEIKNKPKNYGIKNRVCTSYYTLMFGKKLTTFIINPDGNLFPGIERAGKEDLANEFCTWTKPVTSHGEVRVCQEKGNSLKFVLKSIL